MTMANVLLKKEYPKQYTATVSTRVSNSLLVGEIFGMFLSGKKALGCLSIRKTILSWPLNVQCC